MTPERLANFKLRIPLMRPDKAEITQELTQEIDRLNSEVEQWKARALRAEEMAIALWDEDPQQDYSGEIERLRDYEQRTLDRVNATSDVTVKLSRR